jgi:ribosomal protein S18 acetylase RimI-like enzyme
MVEIRVAGEGDEERLAEIFRMTWSEDVTPVAPPRPDEPFVRPDRPLEATLVALDGEEIAGLLTLDSRLRPPSNRHVREVSGLGIDPAYQRRGHARALLAAAIERAREEGAERLTLRVLSANPGAIALYEAAGFEIEGRLRGEFILGGKPVDDVLMALDLTA